MSICLNIHLTPFITIKVARYLSCAEFIVVCLTLAAGVRRQERPLPAIVKDQLTGKSSRTPKFPWSLFDFFQPPTITALQKNMGS